MKKEGPEKILDGTTSWWFPHYRLEGVFDVLYMTHRPGHEHDLWKQAKDKKRTKYHAKKNKQKGTGSTHGVSTDKSTAHDDKRS